MAADGNRDATCTLVLISPDIVRARLSFRRIVLFYVSTPLKLAALFAANEQMPREKGDSKMNTYTRTSQPSSYVKRMFVRKIRAWCDSTRGHAILSIMINLFFDNTLRMTEFYKSAKKRNAKVTFNFNDESL